MVAFVIGIHKIEVRVLFPHPFKEVFLPAVSVLLPVCYASYLYLLQSLLASLPLILI